MRIEIQIRTEEMHAQAENGLAAHWAYKEGAESASGDHPWINDLVEILDHAASAEELLEHTRMAMYQDRIFAFTPKGELIQLPKGATPIDFAYAVHTDLGDQTVGAKINGRVMPLRTPLDNGDQVEILRLQGAAPAAGLAQLRRHRQGAGEDPALGEIEGARGDGRAGPQDFRRDRRSACPARPAGRRSPRRCGGCICRTTRR